MARLPDSGSRKYSESWSPNGMQVVLINDPAKQDFTVQLSVNKGTNHDPPDLAGSAYFISYAVMCGSAKYHGVSEFEDFLEDKEIKHLRVVYPSCTDFNALVPGPFLDEYLDRLANMIDEPDLPKGSIERMEQRFAKIYFRLMNDDYFRAEQVLTRLIFTPQNMLIRKLIKRDDLLRRAHEWFCRFWKPSQMYVLVCGNSPIDAMKERIAKTFGRIGDLDDEQTISSISKSALTIHDNTRQSTLNNKRLARVFTKNDEKLSRVNFQIPSYRTQMPCLYYSYLFTSSQPGTLMYKLKFAKSAKSSDSFPAYYSPEYSCLYVDINLTSKGSENLSEVSGYIKGYVDILRQAPPQLDLFEQSRDFFQYLRITEQTDFMTESERVSAAMRMGYHGSELSYDETPQDFSFEDILKVRERLSFDNCIILSLSSDYVDVETHLDNEFFLQYSVSDLEVEASYDGMSPPQIDPLVGGFSPAFSVETGFERLSNKPFSIYHLPIESSVSTMVRLGSRSQEFKKYPPPAQRLYAAMINHKLWLLHNRVMLDVNIRAVDGALDISVECAPHVLPRLLCLLVEYLMTPIDDEYLDEFLCLKEQEEKLIDSWYKGDPEMQFEHRLNEVLGLSVDLTTQRHQLRQISSLRDLPCCIQGQMFIVIGGNVPRPVAIEISRILNPLHEKLKFTKSVVAPPTGAKIPKDFELSLCSSPNLKCHLSGTCSPSSSLSFQEVTPKRGKKKERKILSCADFEGAAILKAFDFGVFSHKIWATLLVIAQLSNWLVPHIVHAGFATPRCAQTRAIRIDGHMWLVFEVISSKKLERIEMSLRWYISEKMTQVIATLTESRHEELKDDVVSQHFPNLCDPSEQMQKIWEPLWYDPDDENYFNDMESALLTQSVLDVQKLFEEKVSCPHDRKEVTVLFRPSGNDCFAQIRQTDERWAQQITNLYRPIHDSDLLGVFEISGSKNTFSIPSWKQTAFSSNKNNDEKDGYEYVDTSLNVVSDIISHYS